MNVFGKITFRNLMKNKTRTLVTIIGIILSAAMFSAVAFTVSSLQGYLMDYGIYRSGSWHTAGSEVSDEELQELKTCDDIDKVVSLRLLGFVGLEEGMNSDKPYLCVQEMSEGFADMMPVHLTEGRMPENEKELILPMHLEWDGGVRYKLNETITLSLGDRMLDGQQMDNNTPFYPTDDGENPETLENLHTVDYTVVGFYERPDFEDYSAPGYTALTAGTGNETGNTLYQVYFTMKDVKKTTAFMESQQILKHGWRMNNDLLRLEGNSGEDNYNRVLYSLAVILILIIAFGSISLIYNAFSISVSERTKQFGILSSVGATRKQLLNSVLTEGFFLALVGIPLGILAGAFGMGVTFHFLGKMLGSTLLGTDAVTLSLKVSVPALLIAAAASVLTIFLSALIPALRVSKKSAIEAIRQNQDIKVSGKKLRVSGITRKCFGFEGTIAAKNYKRNRKRYRATVVSLFISIVLFISASSFGIYLERSVNDVKSVNQFDLMMVCYPDEESVPTEEIARTLRGMENMKQVSYFSDISYVYVGVEPESLNKRYRENLLQETYGYEGKEPKELLLTAKLVFMEDQEFRNYLEKQNVALDSYFDPEHPKAVALNEISTYNMMTEKFETYKVFDNIEKADLTVHPIRYQSGYQLMYSCISDDAYYFEYEPWDSVESGEEDIEDSFSLTLDEAARSVPVACDLITEQQPKMTEVAESSVLTLYFPYSQMKNLLAFYYEEYETTDMEALPEGERFLYYDLPTLPLEENLVVQYSITCNDHAGTAAALSEWLRTNDEINGDIYDLAEREQESNMLLLTVKIFSYGFIILISLIAAANVFNTISTNINLRRREIAMLKSVGLTPKGFRKMMIFECLLYGSRGLLYGLPVSFIVTYLIYKAVSNGVEMDFFIPWGSVMIAVCSVFLVVAASMIYAVRKIQSKNVIEELKMETT